MEVVASEGRHEEGDRGWGVRRSDGVKTKNGQRKRTRQSGIVVHISAHRTAIPAPVHRSLMGEYNGIVSFAQHTGCLQYLAFEQHDVDEGVLVHRRQHAVNGVGSQQKPGPFVQRGAWISRN